MGDSFKFKKNMEEKKKITICFFGTYDPTYTSNQLILQGLCENNIPVVQVNAPIQVTRLDSKTEMSWVKLLKRIWDKNKLSAEIWEKRSEIKKADVILFATPIWWGGRSSLMQRVLERMDAFDEEYIRGGRSALLNKVAGVVITGSEDGAQATLAGIMEVLTFMNFTLPPQCATYWVGEVGQDPAGDRDRRLKNKAVEGMAKTMARNLVFYANLLKDNPLTEK